MIARRQPTRPLRGLRATFKITRGGWWIYVCRFCGQRYEWPAISGPLGERPELKAKILVHAVSHTEA